jgi:hypothetical protein
LFDFPRDHIVARETIATICWTATASGTVPPIVRLIVTVEAIAITVVSVSKVWEHFFVFLCFSSGPEMFGIFSVVFFSVHFHRLCDILELETVIPMIFATLFAVKPLSFHDICSILVFELFMQHGSLQLGFI